MELNSKEVSEGEHDGKEVWICDYRYSDFNNKPIRHVKPTKVNILNNSETDKRVNYSHSFFREGTKKSSVIKLFDNTGYRWYAGVPLKVFTEEAECREYYRNAAKENLKQFLKYKGDQIFILNRIEKEITINIG